MCLDRWSVESESDRLAFKPSVLLSLAAVWLRLVPSLFSPEPCHWSLIWQIEEAQMRLIASFPHHLRSHLVYPQLGSNGKFLEYLQESLMLTSIPPTSPGIGQNIREQRRGESVAHGKVLLCARYVKK